MPYIAIKAYPKDEETKKKLVDQINEVLLNTWGCPQQAVTISMEEIEPDDWNSKVKETEIIPNEDKMMILNGQKKYEQMNVIRETRTGNNKRRYDETICFKWDPHFRLLYCIVSVESDKYGFCIRNSGQRKMRF